jgi:prepilin-type N-terminal cleavage/methylation domain-containing protein
MIRPALSPRGLLGSWLIVIFVQRRSGARRTGAGTQGFTLIELLVVMAILALLIAIALPRYTGARLKAHRAEIQSDLRNLISAEEAYFDQHYTYSDDLALLDFNLSGNVSITFVEATPAGWSAKGTHANTAAECGIYIGTASPPSGVPVTAEGIIGCTAAN